MVQDEPGNDFGYQQLKEDYNKIYLEPELAEFIVLLIGTYDDELHRSFEDLDKFRTIITKVYVDKEIKFMKALEPGQVWSFHNLRNKYIGVVQRVVNRTAYMTIELGQVTHATADQFDERLG